MKGEAEPAPHGERWFSSRSTTSSLLMTVVTTRRTRRREHASLVCRSGAAAQEQIRRHSRLSRSARHATSGVRQGVGAFPLLARREGVEPPTF